jgi:signal transduction histidine kinase
LLNWALSQSSLLQVHKDWFPLHPVLQQIQEQYAPLIREKEIQFSLHISRSVLIYGDLELLKVALRNCLDNAIKFTPKGGSIAFSETIYEDNYKLSLTDTGIGIPEEILTQLFEMNAKKIQKDTTGRKSSGLGLVLTQSVIQLNDGQISIQQNPTSGTIIHITLPYKQVSS